MAMVMATVTCDCGARVTSEEGPRHAYMTAQPACWRCYGELMARLSCLGLAAPLHMDAYAAQHPGNAVHDRRQRGSVAVHLIVLCAHFDFGLSLPDLHRFRSGISSTLLPRLELQDWPVLKAPESWGPLHASAVMNAPDRDLEEVTYEWAQQVWQAWASQPLLVQGWVQTLLAMGKRQGGHRRHG